MKIKEPLSIAEAIEEVQNGGDVIAQDKATAKRIATEAGQGPPAHDDAHGDGQKPHFHPTDAQGNRLPGHVLY